MDEKTDDKKPLERMPGETTELMDHGPKKMDEKKMNSQFKWILIFLAIALIAVFTFFYFSQSKNKFEYGGIKFERIKFDQLTLYYSKIEQKNAAGNVVLNYNLYLRNDPRKLENIQIDGELRIQKKSIVSVDPEVEYCEYSAVAGGNLGTFLEASGVTYNIAYSDLKYAEERNKSYVVCNESIPHTVISYKVGKENRIVQESKNCYSLEIKDCKILEVTERFIVGAIAQAKEIKV